MKLGGEDVIFYVLTEMQSTDDFLMPYRLLSSMMEIWRDQLQYARRREARRESFRLPAVVPIVLYNGRRTWTAKRRFRETVVGPDSIARYVPDFEYILLDVNRYGEKELVEAGNMIASVFLMEKARTAGSIPERLRDVAGILGNLDPQDYQLFVSWVLHIASRGEPARVRRELEEILVNAKPKEAGKMITNLARKEGRAEGRAEGRMEGWIGVAKMMLENGAPLSQVQLYTRLPLDELEKLQKNMKNIK
jgi:hypothetical protein